MTTEELRKWHRTRLGDSIFDWAEEVWDDPKATFKINDPFPETIDGAASAMPPGWRWLLQGTDGKWFVWSATNDDRYVEVGYTGDEIHDRYLLAKLAWEAMEPAK